MNRTRAFAVEAGPGDRLAALGVVIDFVAARASALECDIPFTNQQRWSVQVAAAAHELASMSTKGFDRKGADKYGQTGVISAGEGNVWNAFVVFAPFAFDATVWDESRETVVTLADEGQSCVVYLSDSDADRVRERGVSLRPL